MSFGSPACDYVENSLDLNRFLINHPIATYFMKMDSDSFKNEGILKGDILVVDRSLPPVDNKLIIAELNGELTVQRLRCKNGKNWLMSYTHSPRLISEDDFFVVWGTVTSVIRKI